MEIHPKFPRYTKFAPEVPIYCLTPDTGRCIHRFFDTSPVSPGGRYLAVFRMPFEDHPPVPGDRGEIVVVDIEEGKEHTVATTAGWETQMGANLNWGSDDDTLIFNDVDTANWQVHGVKLNWKTGRRQTFAKGVYHVSRDGRYAVCGNLITARRTQPGYGVIIPDELVPRFYGLNAEDGVWITDLNTLETRLLISIREVVERTAPAATWPMYDEYENYVFHTKWNRQGDRIMFSLRRYPKDNGRFERLQYDVFTITPDGGELYNAIGAEVWKNVGHHTNWFPDGKQLSLNLAIDGGPQVKFCQVNYDGTGLRKMFDPPVGSGHPTVHASGKFLVTDAYIFEPLSFGDGTSRLRLIDLETRQETMLARIRIEPPGDILKKYGELRVDPHPAWDHSDRYLTFNAIEGDTRRVYIADMSKFIS